MARGGRTLASLLVLLLSPNSTTTPFCPLTQRYDVTRFPPQCIDCPKVIPNRIQLSKLNTVVRTGSAPKFSPGHPKNQTCGCWRAPGNQTIHIALNASWIVSGLSFESHRTRWLREIRVQASGDNQTFMDWGTYTASNFSAASTTLFSYPIRAQFFKITVLRYANHYVDETTGFPLVISALGSQTQPFGCGCPQLSNGSCCQFANMTIRNDTCEWCMDPDKLSTVMVNGCGKCKKGTFEHLGHCLHSRPPNTKNTFQLTNPMTNGLFWTVDTVLATDSNTAIVVYLSRKNGSHPCELKNATAQCMDTEPDMYIPIMSEVANANNSVHRLNNPRIATPYIQYDRGRYVLNMTQPTIRSWAICNAQSCTGNAAALFITFFKNEPIIRTQCVWQTLRFQFEIANFRLEVAGQQDTSMAKIELHHFTAHSAWFIRITGMRLRGKGVYVRWDRSDWRLYDSTEEIEFKRIDPPPDTWNTVYIADYINITKLQAHGPMRTITHDASTQTWDSGIHVRITHGFDFKPTPSPGDSEQLALVTAKSQRPIRLKRLATTNPGTGITTTYTNAKGFIIDPARVLDLRTACYRPTSTLVAWVAQAIWIMADNPPTALAGFINASCALITENQASNAYWLVPARSPTPRTASYQMDVVAEFG
jgi:hypothetical protein